MERGGRGRRSPSRRASRPRHPRRQVAPPRPLRLGLSRACRIVAGDGQRRRLGEMTVEPLPDAECAEGDGSVLGGRAGRRLDRLRRSARARPEQRRARRGRRGADPSGACEHHRGAGRLRCVAHRRRQEPGVRHRPRRLRNREQRRTPTRSARTSRPARPCRSPRCRPARRSRSKCGRTAQDREAESDAAERSSSCS